jgi:hypothetical protein
MKEMMMSPLLIRASLIRASSAVGRHLLCRFGQHTRPVGYGVDACARGCGFAHNRAASRRWCVTLRTGEEFTVTAVNEYHAGSQVVYGPSDVIRVDNGRVIDPAVRVHRDNIAKIELLAATASATC